MMLAKQALPPIIIWRHPVFDHILMIDRRLFVSEAFIMITDIVLRLFVSTRLLSHHDHTQRFWPAHHKQQLTCRASLTCRIHGLPHFPSCKTTWAASKRAPPLSINSKRALPTNRPNLTFKFSFASFLKFMIPRLKSKAIMMTPRFNLNFSFSEVASTRSFSYTTRTNSDKDHHHHLTQNAAFDARKQTKRNQFITETWFDTCMSIMYLCKECRQ